MGRRVIPPSVTGSLPSVDDSLTPEHPGTPMSSLSPVPPPRKRKPVNQDYRTKGRKRKSHVSPSHRPVTLRMRVRRITGVREQEWAWGTIQGIAQFLNSATPHSGESNNCVLVPSFKDDHWIVMARVLESVRIVQIGSELMASYGGRPVIPTCHVPRPCPMELLHTVDVEPTGCSTV